MIGHILLIIAGIACLAVGLFIVVAWGAMGIYAYQRGLLLTELKRSPFYAVLYLLGLLLVIAGVFLIAYPLLNWMHQTALAIANKSTRHRQRRKARAPRNSSRRLWDVRCVGSVGCRGHETNHRETSGTPDGN